MGDPEAAFFWACLGAFPGRKFRRATTLGALRRHLVAARGPVRIISFCSPVIVPPDVIARYPGQCFNFHPGPPELPGFRPSRYAAARHVRTFGVTFHSMVAEVDAGPIHAVRRFAVPAGATRSELDVLTYATLVELARSLAEPLGNMPHRFAPSGDQRAVPPLNPSQR